MKKKISIQGSNLPIIILVILFGLSVSLMTACGSISSNDKEFGKPDSIVANNKATPQVFTIEQKADAIVGKWETTTALDDKIAFEFSPSQKEGDTYAGTYIFYVNDTKDAPAKYIVSGDKLIKFFTDEGKEYPLIKVSVSNNGDSLVYFNQKDEQTRLVKATEKQLKKKERQ